MTASFARNIEVAAALPSLGSSGAPAESSPRFIAQLASEPKRSTTPKSAPGSARVLNCEYSSSLGLPPARVSQLLTNSKTFKANTAVNTRYTTPQATSASTPAISDEARLRQHIASLVSTLGLTSHEVSLLEENADRLVSGGQNKRAFDGNLDLQPSTNGAKPKDVGPALKKAKKALTTRTAPEGTNGTEKLLDGVDSDSQRTQSGANISSTPTTSSTSTAAKPPTTLTSGSTSLKVILKTTPTTIVKPLPPVIEPTPILQFNDDMDEADFSSSSSDSTPLIVSKVGQGDHFNPQPRSPPISKAPGAGDMGQSEEEASALPSANDNQAIPTAESTSPSSLAPLNPLLDTSSNHVSPNETVTPQVNEAIDAEDDSEMMDISTTSAPLPSIAPISFYTSTSPTSPTSTLSAPLPVVVPSQAPVPLPNGTVSTTAPPPALAIPSMSAVKIPSKFLPPVKPKPKPKSKLSARSPPRLSPIPSVPSPLRRSITPPSYSACTSNSDGNPPVAVYVPMTKGLPTETWQKYAPLEATYEEQERQTNQSRTRLRGGDLTVEVVLRREQEREKVVELEHDGRPYFNNNDFNVARVVLPAVGGVQDAANLGSSRQTPPPVATADGVDSPSVASGSDSPAAAIAPVASAASMLHGTRNVRRYGGKVWFPLPQEAQLQVGGGGRRT